jgi:gamma-glutamyl hercynylcysteine S-oxide synthase
MAIIFYLASLMNYFVRHMEVKAPLPNIKRIMAHNVSGGSFVTKVKATLFLIILIVFEGSVIAQKISNVSFLSGTGLKTGRIVLSDSTSLTLPQERPLFTFVVNDKLCSSGELKSTKTDGEYTAMANQKLHIHFSPTPESSGEWSGLIAFENAGNDTMTIGNIVPFGENRSNVYITGFGTDELARACLFRPGFRPVRVILPDNAWEMGYSSFETDKDISVCALARRQKTEGGQKMRYVTILPPKAKVTYIIHTGLIRGNWQSGLRLMFRDRYLYDLEKFDNSMFERQDLAWIKESYLIILEMAWDRDFYDRLTGKYNFGEMLKRNIQQFGHIDVFGIWPTWPRLGLDQRNQWDMYRDLPGGTSQLKNFARLARPYGTRFFIAYNPWDNSTRQEDQYKGMAELISETDADGVVLDTRGSSSYQLQAAADSVRKGVVMFSEGMAVTKDMPGIISGRVHNAIFLSPELNLNKLIKPDFSIFRVCDVGENIIHREIAIAFFNGYGTELNMFRPGGRDEKYASDCDFLSLTTFTLRQNNDAFLDKDWTPFIETTADDIYVNRWTAGEKTVYTILNMKPQGFTGRLFRIDSQPNKHFVSIWNHENLKPELVNGTAFISATAAGWLPSEAGTRSEGSVDCIAEFPAVLKSELRGDSLFIKPGHGRTIIWKGNPGPQTMFKEFTITRDTAMRVRDLFGIFEGKIVVQLVDGKLLKDEDVLKLRGGKPWLISKPEHVKPAVAPQPDMVLVPSAKFSYSLTTREDFIQYPDVSGRMVSVDSFLIDRYPVTNAQYFEFVSATGYFPSDSSRYLRNWESGTFRQGQDRYPVVYVSLEDMKAYAKWAGKRLPTEAEWQLAAQGTDGRKWPWGDEFHATYCNNAFERPTPVDAFPKGQSPCGAFDMVGNIWQMTADMYFDGSYYFNVIRGGSYYKPDSSWWYVEGGPQELDKTQIMLLVSPAFDRSATVGFRCVRDLDAGNFKTRK